MVTESLQFCLLLIVFCSRSLTAIVTSEVGVPMRLQKRAAVVLPLRQYLVFMFTRSSVARDVCNRFQMSGNRQNPVQVRN